MRVEVLLEQFAHGARRVIGLHNRPQVGERVQRRSAAQVRLDALDELVDELRHEVDEVGGFDLRVRLVVHELAYLQVVVRADDRATRDAGQDLDPPQDVQLRELGEHAEVEQRRTKATA